MMDWKRRGWRLRERRNVSARILARGRYGQASVGLSKKRSRLETGWTPGLVAGCNRPARLRAEQAVEVVRNDEDGTCRFDGIELAEGGGRRKPEHHWEWTHGGDVGGGEDLWISSREELGGDWVWPARVVRRKS